MKQLLAPRSLVVNNQLDTNRCKYTGSIIYYDERTVVVKFGITDNSAIYFHTIYIATMHFTLKSNFDEVQWMQKQS